MTDNNDTQNKQTDSTEIKQPKQAPKQTITMEQVKPGTKLFMENVAPAVKLENFSVKRPKQVETLPKSETISRINKKKE